MIVRTSRRGDLGIGEVWVPGGGGGAAMSPGPGPSLLGEHLTKKRTLEKYLKCVFLCDFVNIKKMGTSVRSFSTKFRAEISAMCQKTKDSVLPFLCPVNLLDGVP